MFKSNYKPVYIICSESNCEFKSLKLVVVAFPLCAQGYGNSTTTGPPVSG